jgi:hypothetical protein
VDWSANALRRNAQPPSQSSWELAAGTAIGAAAGYGLGSLLDDWLGRKPPLIPPFLLPNEGNECPQPSPQPQQPPKPPPPIPDNPADSPGEGWEWRGTGPVGSDRGAWYNPDTGESLHPNLDHAPPIGPHWDWIDPNGTRWRIPPGGGTPSLNE